METEDRKAFAECMMGLQEVFTPEKPISKQKIEIYFRSFADMSIEDFQRACSGVLATKTISTFPLPGELRAVLGSNKGLEAWLFARKAVRRYGAGMTVIFPDKVIHSVIEAMGGWQVFSWITTQDMPWKQKEFERLYQLLQGRDNHPERLCGYLEEGKIDLNQELLPGSERKGIE